MAEIRYPVILNGISYAWGSTNIFMLGKNIVGARSINYKTSQEVESIYGSGVNSVQRGFGNITHEASITLLKEEVVALQNLAVNGDLTLIPEFDIQITYFPSATKVVTDYIKKCVFTNNGVTVAQNDKQIEVELTLNVGSIEYGQTI